MVAGSFGIFGGVILFVIAAVKKILNGPSSSSGNKIEYEEPYEKYSPLFLDELESEARSLPQRCSTLGQPTIDEKLIEVMFDGKRPGIDYDEAFAQDLVDYFNLLYQTMNKQGHMQMIKTRTHINKLDELAQKKKDGLIELKEYQKLRAAELHLQNIRTKVIVTEHTIIERAFPYIPNNDGSFESRIIFMTALQGEFFKGRGGACVLYVIYTYILKYFIYPLLGISAFFL